jgi:hypothetical protein
LPEDKAPQFTPSTPSSVADPDSVRNEHFLPDPEFSYSIRKKVGPFLPIPWQNSLFFVNGLSVPK